MTTFNYEMVKEFLSKYKSAQDVFAGLARRERDKKRISLVNLAEFLRANRVRITINDVIDVFSELERMGLGAIKSSKDGRPVYWEWYVSMKQMLSAVGVRAPETKPVTSKPEPKPRLATVAIYSIHDKEIKIQMPAGLTRDEASKVADFIRNLPIAG